MFGSGMAAATAVFLALEKPTHIVASQVMYWGFRAWLHDIGRYGHSVTFVETSDLEAVRDAVRPGETGLFWIETPSNPLWTVTDIAAISEIAHAAGALLCVDSTVATPVFTRPITHGADIVVHSATKYLNGHSDVVAGALAAATTGDFWTSIRQDTRTARHRPGPVRGLAADARDADPRRARARAGQDRRPAGAMAERTIRRCPACFIPGLQDHPGHDIAMRQMSRRLRRHAFDPHQGRRSRGHRRRGRVQVWKRATSLGGVESLIEHRASIEGPGTPCPPDLLRLSVGLEDPTICFSIWSAHWVENGARRSEPIRHWRQRLGHRCRRYRLQDAGAGAIEDPLVAAVAAGGMRGDLRLLHPGSVAHHRVAGGDGDVTGYALYTPVGSEAALRGLLPDGFELMPQCDGDFGARLLQGIADLLQGRPRRRHPGQFRQPDVAAVDPARGRGRGAARRQCGAEPGPRRRLYADRPVEAACAAVRGHSLEHQRGLPADAGARARDRPAGRRRCRAGTMSTTRHRCGCSKTNCGGRSPAFAAGSAPTPRRRGISPRARTSRRRV